MITSVLAIFGIMFALMLCAWIIALIIGNDSVIDAFWPIAITLAATIYTWQRTASLTASMLHILLIIWALRLSGYILFTRIIPGHKDKRYTEMVNNWKRPRAFGLWFNFQFQGLCAMQIALPFLFIHTNGQISPLKTLICACIVLIGIIGESCADIQLQRFRHHHPGEVCNTGLWTYSRHPNLFCDWLIWSGFAIAGLGTPLAWLGLWSPILLLLLMLKVTIPITERNSLRSRGQKYKNYIQQTSQFFPWIRRNKEQS